MQRTIIVFMLSFFYILASEVNARIHSKPVIPVTREDDQPEASDVTMVSILPSATNPAIKTFDNPHSIYINRSIIVDHKAELAQDRHELYLFIPGTHEKGTPRGKGPYTFLETAANLGYHVIDLSYPDEEAASICKNDNNPNAFEKFRLAIIEGGKSEHISIERSESIENRLMKLLQQLQKVRPKENWGQFLNQDGSIKWESIAVGGQSQGGGHAVLIAIKHKVTRVICTGSPKDYNQKLGVPAAFYSEKSATPKDRFFAFNHRQDYVVGTSPEQLLQNLKTLGLDAFGAPADVDGEAFPYRHSRILTTDFPKVKADNQQSEGSLTAHESMINPKNTDHWKQVWTYLLTEPAP